MTSASDAVGLAFAHAKRYLFERFRWGQWVRLAVVGLLAGEMGSGGAHFGVPANLRRPQPQHLHPADLFGNPALLATVVVAVIVILLALALIFLYINSRMRFVLFDSIVASDCRVRQYWARRAGPALRYFAWQVVLDFGALLAVGVVLAPAFFLVYGAGWLEEPRAHLLPLILGAICLGLILLVLIVVLAFIHVLTKDFVVPQMALEGVTVIEGWKRLWRLITADKGGFTFYVILKIALSIAAAVVGGIVGFVVLLLLLIPAGGIGVLAIFGGAAIGLTWNALTVAMAVVAVTTTILVLIALFALMSVPFIVFFPAYSYHFLAGRYSAIAEALAANARSVS